MKTKLQLLAAALLFTIGMNAQFPIVNLTGSGVSTWTPQGSVSLTTTDGVTYTKSNFQIKADGQMKFAYGTADWADIKGWISPSDPNGFPNGTAAGTGVGGSNIIGTLGYWNVTYNYNTKAYSFTTGIDPNASIVLNGASTADIQLATTDGIIYSKQSATLTNGNAKFLETPSAIHPTPTAQWSSASFPMGTGSQTGALIPVTAGIYNIGFEKSTGGYEFNDVPVSLIGNHKGGGWGWNTSAVDELTTVDNVNYNITDWSAMVTAPSAVAANVTTVEFKLIDNHDWGFQFGNIDTATNLTPLTGFMQPKVTADPPNCKLAQGVYHLDFNRITLAYTFTVVSLGTSNFEVSKFNAYPNPTSDLWKFSSTKDAKINNVQISDVTGKVILNQTANDSQIIVDGSLLNSGIYFAKISSDSAVDTIRLIKN